MQNKLFVRNLSFTCADSELGELFTQFGEVSSARIAIDRETGRGRGFGFVEMSTPQEAQDAMLGLDSRQFGGRTIYVAISEAREPRTYNTVRNRLYN